MLTFSDRLWLAWRVLRGSARSFTADAASFRVTIDFTARERVRFGRRVARTEARNAARAASRRVIEAPPGNRGMPFS